MADITLYTSDTEDELLSKAEALLETAYLDYSTEVNHDLQVPKLEIKRSEGREVYRGLKEIDEGLSETDLEYLDIKL